MGFTIVGPNRFVASGHPGFGPVTRLSDPPHLGLIASADGGLTWEPQSLRGQADFHGLVAAHDLVYGYNSRAEQFMVSPDGREWDVRSTAQMLSFAVDPGNPDVVVASAEQGLLRSDDGGRSWIAMAGPAMAFLAWSPESGLWAATVGGELSRGSDGGNSWRRVSRLPGAAAALLVEPQRSSSPFRAASINLGTAAVHGRRCIGSARLAKGDGQQSNPVTFSSIISSIERRRTTLDQAAQTVCERSELGREADDAGRRRTLTPNS